MSSNASTHTPVLIIGGGVVGLSASLFLSYYSIPSMLIERHSGTSIHPRGRSVNARTMELYRSIGISEAARQAGKSMEATMGIYSGSTLKEVIESKPRSKTKRKFPLANLLEKTGPEAGLFVTLEMLEPVLLEAARERGVDTRFSTECSGVSQDGENVIARLRNRDTGNEYAVTADYCIAADGANSPIREQLGIPCSGQGSLGNLLNILFIADLSSLVEGREFSIVKIEHSDPPIYGSFTSINNVDRWVFHLCYDPEKGEKAEDFTREKCETLVRSALGIPDINLEVKSILPWQASVRVAERIQEGRIFLAGDAAHQMPPYAGQGANSGIQDAHNIAWKLATVIQNQASPKLLETYESERLPVGRYAAEVSGMASDERGMFSLNKDFKTIKSLVQRMVLIQGFGFTYDGKGIVKESTWPLGGWSWKAWTMPSIFLGLDGRPGTRVPHLWLFKGGKRISSIDLAGKGWVVLVGSDGEAWVRAVKIIAENMKGVEIKAYVIGPKGDVACDEGTWETTAGISTTGAVLVRPDGFVAWRERREAGNCQDSLEGVMKRLLCL